MFKHYFELIENVSVWPVISLTIFFGFFILMILWLFKVDKKYINRMKNLPLDDDTKTGSTKAKSLILTLLILIAPLALTAQDGSGMDQETMVSLLALTVVIIAILVLMVAIYTLSVLRMTLEQDEPETEAAPDKQWTWFWERFNKSVAPEEERSILLDHNYDGIRELDNHLPPWWTALFYITIAFGVIYMFVYHVFSIAPLPGELYDLSVAEAKAEAAARLAAAGEEGGGIDESTVAFSDDAVVIDNGKKIYDMQCASCHRNDGGGNIGPNLTDAYWLHGGSINEIYSTIKYGVPQKGMIPWEPLLSPEQMRDVSSYIMTMAGSNPPNAKAPQGDLYEPDAGGGSEESTAEEAEA
jgi:cytochrome c oxidase cbb3-type subunit 3